VWRGWGPISAPRCRISGLMKSPLPHLILFKESRVDCFLGDVMRDTLASALALVTSSIFFAHDISLIDEL